MTYQWKWQPQDSLTSSGYVSGAAAGPLPEDPAVYSSSSSRSTSTSRGLLQITQPDILATLVQDLWCKGAGKMFGGALAGFVLFVARGEGPFHVARVTRQREFTQTSSSRQHQSWLRILSPILDIISQTSRRIIQQFVVAGPFPQRHRPVRVVGSRFIFSLVHLGLSIDPFPNGLAHGDEPVSYA